MSFVRHGEGHVLTFERDLFGGATTQGIHKGSPPKDVSFHQIMAYFLGFSRIFGVLPVSNITAMDIAQMRYRWLSVPTAIAVVCSALNGFELLAILNMFIQSGISLYNIGALTFNSVCYLEHLMLWRLATRWPHIMQHWHRVEEVFFTHPYRLYASFNVNLTIKVLSGAILANTFLEHALYLTNSINSSEHQRRECNLSLTFWENLVKNERTQLFILFPFKTWMLPILEWSNFSMAYTQSFSEVFIVSISIGLAARLKQINGRISAVREKPMPDVFWKGVRSDFLAVKNLIAELSTNLSGLILVSCSYSMYFICLQLFNSFLKSGNVISTIFFWYSLLFVIARTLCKLFAAAAVDDAAKQMLGILRDVPSSAWGDEVQLFSDQLLTGTLAFSGCGFFFLTRKLIFAMTATIATYELVMTDVVLASGRQQTSLCD